MPSLKTAQTAVEGLESRAGADPTEPAAVVAARVRRPVRGAGRTRHDVAPIASSVMGLEVVAGVRRSAGDVPVIDEPPRVVGVRASGSSDADHEHRGEKVQDDRPFELVRGSSHGVILRPGVSGTRGTRMAAAVIRVFVASSDRAVVGGP